LAKRILVIDDEQTIRLSLKEGLRDLGYQVFTFPKGIGSIEAIEKNNPHLVILDIRLPDINGIDLLEEIKQYDQEIVVIIITAYGDTKSAVTAIKKGAYDYIEKPFDLDELNIVIKKAFETQDLKKEVKLLKKQQQAFLGDNEIIGESLKMKRVMQKARILASNQDVTVLILGETGVGKGLVARKIHDTSPRRNKPFVDINCGAIPHNLIESELFGFEKNAFTGADRPKKGLIEAADGGTLFLDEIGELPLQTQVKLLRFLEEKKFKRVGGLKDKKVDVRIIAATNKDLEKEVERGRFRKDLFYRLNVVPLHVPPLRHRKEDIIPLAQYFLYHFKKILRKKVDDFSEDAKQILVTYPWPGNVRELRNVIERIMIFINDNDRIVIKKHLPGELLDNKAHVINNNLNVSRNESLSKIQKGNFSLEEEVENLEKECIKQAMKLADGNKTKAAKLLGISRFTLLRRLDKYNL